MRDSLRSGLVGSGNTQFGHMLVSLVLKKGRTVGKKAYSRKDTLDLEVTSPALYKLLTRGLEMVLQEMGGGEGDGATTSSRRRRASATGSDFEIGRRRGGSGM